MYSVPPLVVSVMPTTFWPFIVVVPDFFSAPWLLSVWSTS